MTNDKKPRARHSSGLIPAHFRYKDLSGVSRPKVVYGKTEKEALKKKQDFLNSVNLCLRMDEQGRTVKQWAKEWLAVYKKPNVSYKTLESYTHDVDLLIAAVGARPLKSVTQSELQQLINTRKGLSASAINKTAITLRAVFQCAVDNRLIQYNPAAGIRPPKGTTGTHRALTKEEIKLVYDCCVKGHSLSLPIALMLFAGLRRGEAIAFDPKTDVDTQLHVRRSVTWPVNQPIIKLPKSKAGVRSMPIFNQLRPFLSMENKILSKTVLNDALKSFTAACRVNFTPHDLRHTFCSLLYSANVDIKTAQLWMGHSDPTITMRIYTHLSSTKQSESTTLAMGYFGNIEKSDIENNEQYQGDPAFVSSPS